MQCEGSGAENEAPTECWYWVKATYKGVFLGEVRRRHTWETIVFLIRGPRVYEITIPALVKSKAERVAREKEHEYETTGGAMLRWVFQHLNAIAPLVDDEIEEGTEVYWEFYQKVDKKPGETVAGQQ